MSQPVNAWRQTDAEYGRELLARDAASLWHPYSSMSEPAPMRLVRGASGVRLRLEDGAGGTVEAIDAMSSWWCMIHGYRNPVLDAALKAQVDDFSHVMFGGLTHEPAIRLAERLVEITPDPLQHVFFCDSGSVSIEVAIKLALQYQVARGNNGRTRMLTIRGGYHGDTFAPMSVCDPVNGMHSLFTGALKEQVFGPQPPAGFDRGDDDPEYLAWAATMRQVAAQYRDEVAAIIVEPILQGAGGMYPYSPACLKLLRELADEHGFLLILDEIATGFGRTGKLFASEHAGIDPDILCVGKALTGGYLSLAATLCSTDVAHTVSDGPGGALMHGPTFMANPLACAVALASIDLLLAQDWAARVSSISSVLSAGLAPAADLPGVKDVRVLGAVGVVQLGGPVDMVRVTDAVLRRGVWVRPFRDLVYTMPPYLCTDEEVAMIATAITEALAEGN
ncbi:adenosylmethionine--8-amino-7-oxononanoate transaminase [Kribbella sp. CA-294648]|uniref:adenosylmethionine--8-amino-7-oxononanoate transaminase n=1 Tax=Kribbella sp. CA-294648 TaxID=3239948 RepID=UPI003D934FF2